MLPTLTKALVEFAGESMTAAACSSAPKEAAVFVLSLAKAARRALLSAEGYQVERALAVLGEWMEDAADKAATP